jgi:hypothetical protein
VTNYIKIFSGGYHHLNLGRTTTLPANHATPDLQRGLFRVTCTQNGKCLSPGVPFYGLKGNVRKCQAFTHFQTESFPSRSRRGKKRTLVCQTLDIPVSRIHVFASSKIIEDIDDIQKAGLASLAFFYCDFREDQKRDLRGLLSSILVQLCHQSDAYYNLLSKFYSEHAHGSRPPSDGALTKCLKDLLKLPDQPPVYIVVDALDECPNTPTVRSPRAKVLNLIKELIESHLPNLRVCVTSRLETDIKDVLDHVLHDYVSLHDENGQKRDIEDYIKAVINEHKKNKNWTAEDKQLIIEVLIEKADGM